MRLIALLFALFVCSAGCQARSRAAHASASPTAIVALTDQTLVYSCPSCGMDYDGPGNCPMDGAALVKTRVDYVCPLDHGAVARSGRCPRCAANAQVIRTAIASDTPAPGGASVRPLRATGSGGANGS